MATLVLAAAGAALGQGFGVYGLLIGRAVGALAGAAIDQALFGSSRTVERGQLSDFSVQASTEGSPIPRVYGRARIAGDLIWATRLVETVTSETVGGKGGGGTTVKDYAYSANFAVGLCEGPIARIGRVWANGSLLDLTRVTMRTYLGTEDQLPDSLIEAKQGAGGTPAYRGLAYVVFEGLPLEDFGNAIPQLTFEVIRPVGRLEKQIRGVALIPGATEFGYAPQPVTRTPQDGETESENVHTSVATSDVMAALDDLQAVCPNLTSIALVVTWFGTDLRVGECRLEPRVENAGKATSIVWRVDGLSRAEVQVVSQVDGHPAFGGTPSDASVVALIEEVHARGLKVTFYPFVMMDIPAGNGLADPYGASEQPAYPWRGRITCFPTPGEAGSPDGTAAVASDVAAFVGAAGPGDFAISGTQVTFTGAEEWSYRRMILHYAHLCAVAGGVETFLIGSELRGLTGLSSSFGIHPFVDALVTLAGDVKAILGSNTEVSYAADWTEWSNHRPDDGSGDVTFHLDSLWACADIDFVGIDAYWPLADWRGGAHLDADLAVASTDRTYLDGNVGGGEGYDWYYANEADRDAQIRTPILDAAYGKDFVFRNKDVHGWWSNRHYNRPGGEEEASPTGWLPGLKPIRFTELGCPAVDRGANEPNVFPDLISSEGRTPRFSRGTRDDLMQRRYLEVLLGHFEPGHALYAEGNNPVSPVDGRRMVEWDGAHVWCWDARPYPAFPLFQDIWADGGNWQAGHWLTGRLGTAPLDDLLAAILADFGLAGSQSDDAAGIVDGFVIGNRTSARSALEPLATLFRLDCVERTGALVFKDRGGLSVGTINADDLVEEGEQPLITLQRAEEADIPARVDVGFLDGAADYLQASVSASRVDAGGGKTLDLSLSGVAAPSVMQGYATALLKDLDTARLSLKLALGPEWIGLEPGDRLVLAIDGYPADVIVQRIERTLSVQVEARAFDRETEAAAAIAPTRSPASGLPVVFGPPRVAIIDLPTEGDAATAHQPRIAAAAQPWPGSLGVYKAAGTGYGYLQTLERPAVMGTLATALLPGALWRFDRVNTVEVRLLSGTLASVTEAELLDGANAAAIETPDGSWELIQFQTATLIGTRTYRLETLLRGQLGTEDQMAKGHAAGASFILIDAAAGKLQMPLSALGRDFTFRVGPPGRDVGDAAMRQVSATVAGRGLLPLAPVHLGARRLASGDIDLTWVRRTRIGGDSWEQTEVPLAEEAEAYEVDIEAGGAVVRTIAATSPAATYPAAAEASDFGAPVDALTFSVRQMSASYGRGIAAMTTVSL
ncbi:hypothetical protein HDIA_1351 [Hartmannibacter diazotrophicus]|uniref:Tail protein n=1 Tax=Hartmannibacter diazotrophicus TaxID=1482074 RepID=A0A2C9D3L5_9HYPH|nr:glycoside hydrolase/phage tail family protein [Hartmannibacter diazotrophicus]SON54892.1 hypothetical protein HDIA_1351 [Hartmannibacter diazotrophicus]